MAKYELVENFKKDENGNWGFPVYRFDCKGDLMMWLFEYGTDEVYEINKILKHGSKDVKAEIIGGYIEQCIKGVA